MTTLSQYVKECILLYKHKEDEVTWSKIDNLFIKLKDEICTVEDCNYFLDKAFDLLLRSILSERSKLSGTSLNLLKKLSDILQDKLKDVNTIILAILKLSGRSNKVVFTRAHEALIHICQYIDMSQYSKTFVENYESNNKNVRLGIIKALTNSNKDIVKLYKIIEKGTRDSNCEIRNICKAYMTTSKKTEQKASEIKELPVNKINIVEPEISHSPLKKIIKIEQVSEINLRKDTGKCSSLPKLTTVMNKTSKKNIAANYKPCINFKTVKNFKDADLTPNKLDKFLVKYRSIYGNLLEIKDKDEEKTCSEKVTKFNDDKDMHDLSREIENLSIVEESKLEDLKHDYTILSSEKTFVEPDFCGSNKSQNGIKDKVTNKKCISSKLKDGSAIASKYNLSDSLVKNNVFMQHQFDTKNEDFEIEKKQDCENKSFLEVESTSDKLKCTYEQGHTHEKGIIDSKSEPKEQSRHQDLDNTKVDNSKRTELTAVCHLEKTNQNIICCDNESGETLEANSIEIDYNNKHHNIMFMSANNENLEHSIEKRNEITGKESCELHVEGQEENFKKEISFINEEEKQVCQQELKDQNICKVDNNVLADSNTRVEKHEKLSATKNTFISLLHADKEECVIYDINADSPIFKNQKNILNADCSHINSEKTMHSFDTSPESIVNMKVGSSFLYVNESLLPNPVDYTKIDSAIYADKNLFNKKDIK